MKKYLRSLLVTLVAIAIVVPLVRAATIHEIPLEIEIVPGVKDVAIYSTANMTSRLSGVKIASLRRGSSTSVPLWLKNNGEETVNLAIRTAPDTFVWGTVTFTPASFGLLGVGSSVNTILTVSAYSFAATGNVTPPWIQTYEP